MVRIIFSRDINGEKEITCAGSLPEIVSELGFCLADLYANFKERDPASARVFKVLLQAAVDDRSPVWTKGRTPGSTTIYCAREKECGHD